MLSDFVPTIDLRLQPAVSQTVAVGSTEALVKVDTLFSNWCGVPATGVKPTLKGIWVCPLNTRLFATR